MAMIKRLLLMLKSQIIPLELLPDLISHLKIFVKAGWSTETIKSVCTYLMYTLPKEEDFSEVRDLASKLKPTATQKSLEDAPVLVVSAKSLQHQSYHVQVRNSILEMLLDVLCEKSENSNYASDFVRAISSRWVVLFCGPRLDSYTVSLACRIFAKLWVSHDQNSSSKFKESFLVISRLLQPYSNVLELYPSLLSVLCGIDVSGVPIDVQYEVSTLMAVMKPLGTKARRNISPDVMRVITSLMSQTVRLVNKWSVVIDSLDHSPEPAALQSRTLSRKLFDGSTDSIHNMEAVHLNDPDCVKARTKLESLSEIVQTTTQFIGTMYRHLEDMKDSVCRQDTVDEIVSLLFQLISTGSPLSLAQELAAKGEAPEADEINFETIFKSMDQGDSAEQALKLRLRFMEIEAPDTGVPRVVICVLENLHIGHVSCAAFLNQSLLVTGGSDMCVCIWELTTTKRPDLSLVACMRGHRKKVLCLAVSRSYSIIVSGGEDGIGIIWDINRQQYVRSLTGNEGPVTSVAVHEGTGDIMTCCGTLLRLWNVNGELQISKVVATSISDLTMCCAFYEPKSCEVFDSNVIFTGYKKGYVKIWNRVFVEAFGQDNEQSKASKWDLKCVKTLEPHTNPSAITLISASSSGRFLLTGDVSGRVTSWM
eukprot:jgi/Hompol1/7112/HPOL_000655-RA